MKFIVDNQLPPALAAWLVVKGHEAEHVFPLGMANMNDGEIWNWAIERRAVVVTKDADFAERRLSSTNGPTLLWLRVGNTTTPALLARLDEVWADIEVSLSAGRPVIEVR